MTNAPLALCYGGHNEYSWKIVAHYVQLLALSAGITSAAWLGVDPVRCDQLRGAPIAPSSIKPRMSKICGGGLCAMD